MQAIKLTAEVSESRELRLQLPDSIAPGRVEVLILKEEAPSEAISSNKEAVLAAFKLFPKTGVSKEEIDARIQAERDAWE